MAVNEKHSVLNDSAETILTTSQPERLAADKIYIEILQSYLSWSVLLLSLFYTFRKSFQVLMSGF